jgi:hypothetical protein
LPPSDVDFMRAGIVREIKEAKEIGAMRLF